MESFHELLATAKTRDAEALALLHDRYARKVLARIRENLNPSLRRRYDTMDLGQSVFLEVLRDLPRFEDRGERAFRNWLYIKAENKVRMKLRRYLGKNGHRRERTMGAEPVGPDATPVDDVSRMEERSRLDAALARLEPGERELLRLREERKLPYAEIARLVGAPSANAARMRHVRALMALRAQWKSA